MHVVLLLLIGLSGLFFLIANATKHLYDDYLRLIVLYCSILVFSTIINKGNIGGSILTSVDNSFLSLSGLAAAISLFIKNKNLRGIELLLRYFEILIILNLISVVMFPGGMYSTGQLENYFLGFENTHSTTFLFAIALAFVRDKLFYGDDYTSKETIALIVICNLNVFLCTSVATIVQFVLLDFALIFCKPLMKTKIFSSYVAIGINFIISVFLLFFYSILSSQKWFHTFVVDVLGKDMTFMARTYIWDSFLLMISEKPILGYGVNLDSLLQMSQQYMGFGSGSSHAHNEYLTNAYYGGIVMLCLLIIIIFKLAKVINKGKKDTFNWRMLVIFFLTMFFWNTESLHMPLQIATFTIIYYMPLIEQRSQQLQEMGKTHKKHKVRFKKVRV